MSRQSVWEWRHVWEKSYMSPGRNPQIFNSLGQTANDVIPSKTTQYTAMHCKWSYVCMFVCLYVCIFVCLYVCMFVCMYCTSQTEGNILCNFKQKYGLLNYQLSKINHFVLLKMCKTQWIVPSFTARHCPVYCAVRSQCTALPDPSVWRWCAVCPLLTIWGFRPRL